MMSKIKFILGSSVMLVFSGLIASAQTGTTQPVSPPLSNQGPMMQQSGGGVNPPAAPPVQTTPPANVGGSVQPKPFSPDQLLKNVDQYVKQGQEYVKQGQELFKKPKKAK